MQTSIKRAFLVALIFLTSSAPAFGLPRDVVERVKKVTALVEVHVGRDRGFGTAFCIDAKGLFVTNAHVVEDAHKFTVILCPGETDQRIVNAKVLKVDDDMDLALLQIENPGTLKALELGDASTLFDTMDLTAFGYPFGMALASSDKEYPSISVSTGHLTSLRKKDGELDIIQLDCVLNPGNSGGPVLDSNGQIVGIVQAGLPGAGINFAIPVSRLQKFLKDPASHRKSRGPQAAPEPPPVAERTPPADANADPFHGKQWELTTYLKGTAPQIRDKLNGEVERLIAKIRETQDTIKRASQSCVTDEQTAITNARASAAYNKISTEKAKAEQDLDTARKSGASQEKLDASSRFNKARMALEKMEHDAVINCDALSQDRHRMYEAQHDVKRYTEALDKAVAWREELLDATRNGFMMKGPARDGVKGTLPRVTIAKVEDGSHVVVDYDLLTFDFDHPGKEKEGIKSFNAVKTRIKIRVAGVNTSKMKQGDKTSLDHVYVLDGMKHTDNQGTIYTASPFASDADILFDTIVPLRESLPEGKSQKADASK